ncbi:MAG: hypothetical protein PF444_07110, partial [Bacteroidales bacterium]|nr:hypothetical protein [Bacteroidales bacterium]
MTVEEFWDKYTHTNILEVFDDACELFSEELPDYFIEEYDIEEILLEVRGQQEREKNFDNVLKFTKIIKHKHPDLYQEVFQYYDDFLVDYYCFKQDSVQVKNAFSNFIEKPLRDFDAYLIQLNRLLYYKHTEILLQAVDENYSVVGNSDRLIGGAEIDLAFIKMYTSMQAVYESEGKEPDISTFISKMKEFGFEFEDSYSKSIDTGLLKPVLDNDDVNTIFKKNKESAFVIIRSYFLRYMLAKDIPFYVSAKITDSIPSYWYAKNSSANTTDTFFKIKTESFDEFLNGLSGDMFSSNESEVIATLWGIVHFYEFAHLNEYISQQTFDDFLETSKVLKGRVIARYLPDLWKSNFIHLWAKPDCISETEFTHEHTLFKKSTRLKYKPFDELKPEISDELTKIGELAKHIIGSTNHSPSMNTSLLDTIFDPDYNPSPRLHEYTSVPYIREEKKVKRNDPGPCGSG